MRVLLDACVLYPTVMREVVLAVAGAGLFRPLWSPRILEEWARAVGRDGPAAEAVARGEIALLGARFPDASVAPRAGDMARLHLPDENDIHVLAAAVAGHADLLLTMNARDFPRGALRDEGLGRADPDGFLAGLWVDHPDAVAAAVERVRAEAERLSGQPQPLRPLLKRARLPRLGKALG